MNYPSKLLPKIFYGFINLNRLSRTKGYWLLRNCDKELIDIDLNSAIAERSSLLKDLSVSLGGHYERDHANFEILKDLNQFDYHQRWTPLSKAKTPNNSEFEILNSKDCIFFKLEEINNYPFNDTHPTLQTNISYKCKVEHIPTYANFWHCEIRWYDEHGNILEKKGKRIFPVEVLTRFKNIYRNMTYKPSNVNKVKKLPLLCHIVTPKQLLGYVKRKRQTVYSQKE